MVFGRSNHGADLRLLSVWGGREPFPCLVLFPVFLGPTSSLALPKLLPIRDPRNHQRFFLPFSWPFRKRNFFTLVER